MQDKSSVQSTNDDASVSKWSAVQKGYLIDPFIHNFVKRKLQAQRSPVLNRGTYTRTQAMDYFVRQFLNSFKGMRKQIISLGAGSDTRYFLLKKKNESPDLYIEIDFPEITSKKAMTIMRSKEMSEILGQSLGGQELYAQDYVLLSGDLTQNLETIFKPKLISQGFDPSIPTLFLSECFLVYLPVESSDELIKSLSSWVPNSSFITYEQIEPNDLFGQMMIRNLLDRNLTLPGLQAYPTLESQKMRYVEGGFPETNAMNLNEFWDDIIPGDEKERIQKTEFLDEMEEWRLFGEHYCIIYAQKS